MYKYILFDLDGTLTDPKEGICRSVQYALEKMDIIEEDIEKLTPFIGPPLKASFAEHYGMDEENCDKAVEYYRERFSKTGWKENIPYEGIGNLLAELKGAGMKLAVASSKPTVFVEKILKYFGLRRFFSVVIGSELNGRRIEKDEIVEEALKQLYEKDRSGKSLEELKNLTVMVGDRKYDVEGAHQRGIEAIGVAYGYQLDGELADAGADAIASDMEELADLLLGGTETENDRVKKLPRTSFGRAVYMLMPFVVYVLIFRVSVIFTSGLGRLIPDGTLYLNIANYAVIVLIYFFFFRKKEPMDLFGKVSTTVPASALFCGMFLAYGLNIVATAVMENLQSGEQLAEAASFHADVSFLPGLLMYVICSPLCEELCFRWLMYGRIRRCMGAKLAIFTTALFFGVFHGNPVQGVYAFIMGLVMAVVYERTGAFLTTLLFHVGANAVIYVAAFAEKDGAELNPAAVAVACLLASLPLLWYLCRENKAGEKKRTGK